MSRTISRARLELDQRRAGVLHAALSETLGAQLRAADRRETARKLRDQLDIRVPGWLNAQAGFLVRGEAVLRTLVDVDVDDVRVIREPLVTACRGPPAALAL